MVELDRIPPLQHHAPNWAEVFPSQGTGSVEIEPALGEERFSEDLQIFFLKEFRLHGSDVLGCFSQRGPIIGRPNFCKEKGREYQDA